ncbi:hypothetical protein ABTE32_21730, partial [Acinetobacter baumannii]
MKFIAPADVTAISLSVGEFKVIAGFVETPDELPDGDIQGLVANGFAAAPVAAPEPDAASDADPDPAQK